MIKYYNHLTQINEPKYNILDFDISELNISIFGMRGNGKSTFARNLVYNANKLHKKTIIVFDSQNEYDGDFHFWDIDSFYNRIENFGLQNSIYVCKFRTQDEFEELFDIIHELENVLSVVEECSNYSKPQGIYDSFKNIIAYGRHRKLTYIGIARRPAEIHKDIIANSHFIVTFKQILDNDIKIFQEFGFTESVRSLKPFEYELIKT